jgi:hypothetical protein
VNARLELGPALADPLLTSEQLRAAQERDELLRQACQRYIDQVKAGRPADPDYLANCNDVVRRIKPLQRALTDGEPRA